MYTYNVTVDSYFYIKSANASFFELIGSTTLTSVYKLIHPEDVERIKQLAASLSPEKEAITFARLYTKNEVYVEMLMSLSSHVLQKTGNVLINISLTEVSHLKTYIDTLNSKNLDRKFWLSMSNKLFFKYEFAKRTITILDFSNKNKTVSNQLNFDEWYSAVLASPLTTPKIKREYELLITQAKNCTTPFSAEISSSYFSKDSNLQRHELYVIPIFKGNSTNYDLYGTLKSTDIEASDKKEDEHIIPTYDSLTGVMTKAPLISYIKGEINKNTASSIHLVIIDIDNFKTANDTYGHLFGDKILKRVADLINYSIQGRGIVGRFGGDEFFIVFEGITSTLEIRSYLRAIRTNIEQGFSNLSEDITITCSIGSAMYPHDATTYEELFQKADIALYSAKEKGKNRYIIYHQNLTIAMEGTDDANKVMFSANDNAARFKFFEDTLSTLMFSGYDAISDIMEDILKRYNLGRISLFLGNTLERASTWGSRKNIYPDASYILIENYMCNFDTNNVAVINHLSKIEIQTPTAYKILKHEGVFSFVSYLIYDNTDSIKGLISFEALEKHSKWNNEDIFSLSLIASLMSKLILKHAQIETIQSL